MRKPDRHEVRTKPLSPDTSVNHEFCEFYRNTVKQLVGFLVLQGSRLADAADVAQDTLALAYQHWPTIDNPKAWCFRVASRAWARKHFSAEEPTADPPEHTPLLFSSAVAEWELRHDLVRALRTLPPRQRQVITWALYEYSPAEIARELGIRDDAVRSNLYRARQTLAQLLAGPEGSR